MTTRLNPDEVFQEIACAAEEFFCIRFSNATLLDLGWMNLKWKVESSDGDFVIKQYSQERYRRFGFDKVMAEFHIALQEQMRQHHHGLPCPRLLTHKGNIIQTSPSGERFVIMEYMAGSNLAPGSLNCEQMYSLGRVTARMRNLANDGFLGKYASPKFVPTPMRERLLHWRNLLESAEVDNHWSTMIEAQLIATEEFSLEEISSREPGWAHRDLWVDNLLFEGNDLTAILDFDRFGYDYPELDVARAIISGVLRGDGLRMEAVTAFVEGYREHRPLDGSSVVGSMRMLWYMESPWWIVPTLNSNRYQEVRFAEEMMWLAKNRNQLGDILGHL